MLESEEYTGVELDLHPAVCYKGLSHMGQHRARQQARSAQAWSAHEAAQACLTLQFWPPQRCWVLSFQQSEGRSEWTG
jgi:hypothetical protein